MTSTLFVGNLHYLTEKEELFAHLSKFGEIIKIYIPIDRETGNN
jgi:RNA recognition motif-containing protein